MAYPQWPSWMPNPNYDGYGITPDAGAVVTSQMDNGASISRQRFTNLTDTVDLQWSMNGNEFAAFDYFYRKELQMGTLWAEVPLADGLGIRQMLVKFVTPPQCSHPTFNFWTCSAKLQVWERSMLTDDQYEVVAEDGPESIMNDSSVLHAIVHDIFPATLG